MKRTELLTKLTTVSPALADTQLIPMLSHFWFTGHELMGYNDKIAISVPFKSEFAGAIPGTVLQSLIKNSRAKEVEFNEDRETVTIKAASSRFKLGYLPADDFMFEMPDEKGENLPVNKEMFLEALSVCMRTVGSDSSVVDNVGITVVNENNKGLTLYSTTGNTMSRAEVEMAGTIPFDRVLLSGLFCSQLLRMARESMDFSIKIYDDHAMFYGPSDTVMFGRLLESDSPLDFKGVFEKYAPQATLKKLIMVPTKLGGILERASIITDSPVDQGSTLIRVKDGVARFESKSDRGEVIDRMQVEERHPDAELRVEPKLLKAGYKHNSKILFRDNCIIMSDDNENLYLVAAQGV